MNQDKCVVMPLDRNTDLPTSDQVCGLSVLQDGSSVKYLGIPFARHAVTTQVINSLENALQTSTATWLRRARTVQGRRLLASSVILSRLWHVSLMSISTCLVFASGRRPSTSSSYAVQASSRVAVYISYPMRACTLHEARTDCSSHRSSQVCVSNGCCCCNTSQGMCKRIQYHQVRRSTGQVWRKCCCVQACACMVVRLRPTSCGSTQPCPRQF